GRLSPIDGIGPHDLTIDRLLARIDTPMPAGSPRVEEVVLGLNPTTEGDGTALYLARELKPKPVRVTRLARGLPTGSSLEFVNRAVLTDAIQGRRSLDD
ncbi:MAG: toprim domain-containing protein, partial [Phycisphaerales bacterium]|nr:toprim domain-containing protein [Phycisphaerales bacterium]